MVERWKTGLLSLVAGKPAQNQDVLFSSHMFRIQWPVPSLRSAAATLYAKAGNAIVSVTEQKLELSKLGMACTL